MNEWMGDQQITLIITWNYGKRKEERTSNFFWKNMPLKLHHHFNFSPTASNLVPWSHLIPKLKPVYPKARAPQQEKPPQ